jgi:leucyl aminopeptidase
VSDFFHLVSGYNLKVQKIFLSLLVLALAAALPSPTAAEPTCGAGPVPASLIQSLSAERWAGWIGQLSGETPVRVGGAQTLLVTRYTPAMFWDYAPAFSKAYEFVLEQARQWYPDKQITEQSFPMGASYSAKNLVVDLPGAARLSEVVILSAHLDSISPTPYTAAPGAEDNASGSAALLEAARLLRSYRFERTLRLIWFSGEEQGLVGSLYYVNHLPPGETIVGVINLDMYGYDADDDHCFELHVGTLPASSDVGQCFSATTQASGLGLSFDYLTSQGQGYSDHASFWEAGLGAVEVLENHSDQGLPGGCAGRDANPNYHRATDTLATLNLAAGIKITQAALATAANLALPTGICLDGAAPQAAAARQGSRAQVSWTAVTGASSYRVRRSAQGCAAGWELVWETSSLSWTEEGLEAGLAYRYEVEAVGAGRCVSLPSPCANAGTQLFLPAVRR